MMAGKTITSAYFTTRWGRRRRRLEVAPRFINPLAKPRFGENRGLSRSTFVDLRRVSADPYSGRS